MKRNSPSLINTFEKFCGTQSAERNVYMRFGSQKKGESQRERERESADETLKEKCFQANLTCIERVRYVWVFIEAGGARLIATLRTTVRFFFYLVFFPLFCTSSDGRWTDSQIYTQECKKKKRGEIEREKVVSGIWGFFFSLFPK